MKLWCRYSLIGIVLLAGGLRAQLAHVRPAPGLSMPTAIDSNSPSFWWEGRFYMFGGQGRPLLSQSSSQTGPWETRPVEVLTKRVGLTWIESAWCDRDGTIFGWYHTEPVGLIEGSLYTAPQIGAVVSVDGGKTMLDLGIILSSGDPIDPLAENGFFVGGHGDFSVILDQKGEYFYFFFGNYGGAAESQGVAVARLPFADRFDPAGKVQKYFQGAWSEPGLEGRVTPVYPVRRSWRFRDPDAFWGPSIHWNTHLSSYVIVLNHAQGEPGWSQEGIYVSFNPDLSRPESWSAPAKILDRAELPGWQYFYPQVLGLAAGETDTLAGRYVRLFVYGQSKWEIEFSPLAASVPEAPPPVVEPIDPAAESTPLDRPPVVGGESAVASRSIPANPQPGLPPAFHPGAANVNPSADN